MINNRILLSTFLMLSSAFALNAQDQVTAKETKETIPTYLVGNPDLYPYFFNGRTYQGAAGHIYPYALYDNLTDERVDRDYKYLTLENEYTKIGVLPEIGGRIFQAEDKQTGYNFFYRQHVIKPALIGMIGSWISGGVEWNIPHHHRASSTLNAGYEITENEDGSKTIWIGETELRQRLKWTIGLTMFPGKSYVEATFKMQNRTPIMQSFLYWANVSVHCDENYQVQFPPQTIYGTAHSKVQYTDWPYNTIWGNSEPTDNSWWKNFKDANSTFAVNYTQDYLVGYDFGKNAGTAHWANHHLVPGKKFFLWGTNSVWNEMLTEKDGAYLELMVGTFSDNQPDYSWIGPNEVRVTKQYWYPIKGIGGAKNVNLEGAVNIERTSPDNFMVGFNSTALYKQAKVIIKAAGDVISEETVDIDPDTPYIKNIKVSSTLKDSEFFAGLYDSNGVELVSWSPAEKEEYTKPHPADRPKQPSEYNSVEELLLAGQRLEEFHNARLDPLPYYEEALRRDSLDSRVNVNLGTYYAKRAEWTVAEKYLSRAYKRLTGLHYMPEIAKTGVIYHTNPKDGEMFYYSGVVARALGKISEAESYFWKSTWYPGFQSASYLYLAEMYWKQGKVKDALEAIDESIALSGKSTQSKFIKAHFLSTKGKKAEAVALLDENIASDPIDFLSIIEKARIQDNMDLAKHAITHMGIPLQEIIEVTTFYNAIGAWDDAVAILDFAMENGTPYSSTPMQKNAVEPFTASPLLNYMAGWYSSQAGHEDKALDYYRKAAEMSPDYCFTFRVEELEMLRDVLEKNPTDWKAYYYLGNLLYYYDRKDEAIAAWKSSAELNSNFGMTFRNLGHSAYKYLKEKNLADKYYNMAINADNSNPIFFQEMEDVEAALNVPSEKRLARMEKYRKTVEKSDDATSRFVYLLIDNGKYRDALDILENRHFRVWEGGSTVYTQFVDANLLYGLSQLAKHHNSKALESFLAAGTFPRNLETNELSNGPLVAKVAYHQGLAYKALGQKDKARESFEKCILTAGSRRGEYIDERYYFVAMSQKELGQETEAKATLKKIQDYIDSQNTSATTVVDIYSKFGEDGSSNVIKARNLYLQGLVHLASGDRQKAHQCFCESLDLNQASVWTKYFRDNTK